MDHPKQAPGAKRRRALGAVGPWLRSRRSAVWGRAVSALVVITVATGTILPSAASAAPFPTAPSAAAPSPSAPVRPPRLAPDSPPVGATALGSVPGGQELGLNVVLPPSHGDQVQSLLQGLYDPAPPSTTGGWDRASSPSGSVPPPPRWTQSSRGCGGSA